MGALHDLLDELATSTDDAHTRELPTATAVWRRGRRTARIRRTAAAAAMTAWALVIVVAGFTAWGVVRSPSASTADAERPVLLPTRLYTPSRWLPGTSGHPIGPLVALVPAVRGERSLGLAGVSGVTGEYRFLDLPGRANAGVVEGGIAPPALSPGGRYVAYWLAGQPSGAPWHHDEDVVVGVAAYDTVMGTVATQPIATEHGLNPWALRWLGDDRLFVLAGQHQGAAGSSSASSSSLPAGERGTVWTISTNKTLRLDGLGRVGPTVDSITADGRIVFSRLEDGTVRVADASTSRVRFQDVRVAILSMPDDDHVALVDWDGTNRNVLRVDVHTGVRQTLTLYPTGYQYGEIIFALDALARDPVERPAPARPWDPRRNWGLVAAFAGVGAIGVVLWRRRVRP